MKRAAAIGMFDGVHLGHQALVHDVSRHAHKKGLEPAIFTFDRHPLELVAPERAPRLLTTVEQRERLLRQAGATPFTLAFDHELRSLTAREFMLMLQREYGVELLVMGFNHRFGHDRLSDFNQYQAIGREIGMDVALSREAVIDGLAHPVSSSEIRRALAAGDASKARLMLGRNYAIEGQVAHGRNVGHTIGFPTANVRPDEPRQLIPKRGAYAAIVNIDGVAHRGMVNVGYRPTVDDSDNPQSTIEAHVFDFDQDIYGKKVSVEFAERLRDEQKFSSLSALKSQLQADKEACFKINL